VAQKEIRRRTRVADVISRVAELNWIWVTHVALQNSKKLTIRVVGVLREQEVEVGRKDAG